MGIGVTAMRGRCIEMRMRRGITERRIGMRMWPIGIRGVEGGMGMGMEARSTGARGVGVRRGRGGRGGGRGSGMGVGVEMD